MTSRRSRDTSPDTLCLELCWGDTILDHVELGDRRTAWVGSDPDVDLRLEVPAVGPRFPLITRSALGDPVLNAPEEATLRRSSEISTLRAGAAHVLISGERVEVPLGALRLIVRRGGRAERSVRGMSIDPDYLRIAALCLVLHAGLLGMVLVTPARSAAVFDGLRKSVTPYWAKVLEPPARRPARARGPRFGPRPGAPRPEGVHGPVVDRPRRPGPRAADDRRRNLEKVQKTGLVAMLRDQLSRGPGVLAPGGLSGVNDALAQLGVGGLADAGGAGGLGVRGRGPGGGGDDGALGIGDLGRPGPLSGGDVELSGGHRRVEVRPCGTSRGCRAQVKGGLSHAEIAQVMNRNRPRFKFCYERELAANPHLSGKIAVRFTIAPDGTIAVADIAESTVDEPRVEACVLKTTRSLRFPSPRGGGIVMVTYPFLFSTVE
ncbi:MAG: AgmX/PglI C-terminal domain-containing protein [Deltaproteobacteria bacterium]|nr:AgmX/PglI C-terminal domain-containing protein [Deltaproteobacteria bacterium]